MTDAQPKRESPLVVTGVAIALSVVFFINTLPAMPSSVRFGVLLAMTGVCGFFAFGYRDVNKEKSPFKIQSIIGLCASVFCLALLLQQLIFNVFFLDPFTVQNVNTAGRTISFRVHNRTTEEFQLETLVRVTDFTPAADQQLQPTIRGGNHYVIEINSISDASLPETFEITHLENNGVWTAVLSSETYIPGGDTEHLEIELRASEHGVYTFDVILKYRGGLLGRQWEKVISENNRVELLESAVGVQTTTPEPPRSPN